MFTIKERALVLQERVKNFLKAAKDQSENDKAVSKFGIISCFDNEEELFEQMKSIKKLVDDMASEVAKREAEYNAEKAKREEQF